MKRQRMVLVLALCCSLEFLAVKVLSQSNGSSPVSSPARDGSQNKADEQRKAESRKTARELELEGERRRREFRKNSAEQRRQLRQKWKEDAKEGRGPFADREKKRKELQEMEARIRREFLREKAAIGASEEQWQLIKPLLERVRQLHRRATSTTGLFLAGGSSDNVGSHRTGARANVPTWQWKDPWKDKAPGELTKAQRLVQQIVGLLGRDSTSSKAFRNRIDALRKARHVEEAKFEKRLAEARRELREVLTTRQQAALVLMDKF